MPSLRRSLILYFLLLVGLALGGLGLLIDQFADNALAARLESETRRIDAEHSAAVKATIEKSDDQLLAAAQALAKEYRDKMWSLTQSQFSAERVRDRFNLAMGLSLLGTTGEGWSTATTAVFLPLGGPPLPPTASYNSIFITRIQMGWQYYWHEFRQLSEKVRNEFQLSSEHPDYYQLHLTTRDRQVIRSPKQSFELPAKFEPIAALDGPDHVLDEFAVADVGLVRRIRFRSPFTIRVSPQFNFGGPPPSRPRPEGSRPEGSRPEGPRSGPRPEPPRFEAPDAGPRLYVQVASPKADLDAAIEELVASRDVQIRTVSQETAEAKGLLRLRIALIGGITFAAVVLGCWLLIGFGLSPLRKLSDAVSQVSEKDFRLPVEKEQLTSELVPIHDRLTQSLDALRRAFEREKAAVADISHELRTPVAGMLATLDVALRKPRSAEQYKETLTECRAIAKQLGGLVERVMTLAYLDAGHSNSQPVNVDFTDLAENCAAVVRPLATAHGLTLTTELPPATEVRTDPDRLREVLMNLLHNAIEYNKPEGKITLRAMQEPAGLTVEVEDTGIGMTEDVKAKIFDRFFRADPSRTATGAHAGLGLAIVKEAVGRLGGSITVESTPAQGSTFRVRLPG